MIICFQSIDSEHILFLELLFKWGNLYSFVWSCILDFVCQNLLINSNYFVIQVSLKIGKKWLYSILMVQSREHPACLFILLPVITSGIELNIIFKCSWPTWMMHGTAHVLFMQKQEESQRVLNSTSKNVNSC